MRTMKKLLKKILILVLKKCIDIKSIPRPVFDSQKVKKILVYAYTGLGNFVLYTPALRAIKEFFPQATFTLLHGNDTGCHKVVSGSNLFDKHIVVKRNANWWIRSKWIYKLRKEKYDLIVSEFHSNYNLFTVFLTILSDAMYKLGHVSSAGWNNDWDWIYNISAKMKKNQHERDRYLELAHALEIQEQKIDKKPFICISSTDEDFAKKFLASHGVNNKHKIVSVQFGTSSTTRWKRWSLDKYKKLCDMISELPNVKVVIQGSPSEVDMIISVAVKMNNKPIIAAGNTSVKQVAAILKESNLLICNDSGLMHIAVAVGIPVVAIYGPTDYTRTAPLGEKHTIVRRDLNCSPCFRIIFNKNKNALNCPYDRECLRSITVDEVFRVVKKIRSG